MNLYIQLFLILLCGVLIFWNWRLELMYKHSMKEHKNKMEKASLALLECGLILQALFASVPKELSDKIEAEYIKIRKDYEKDNAQN